MVFNESGDSEVLHVAEIPDPVPQDGEVLIRVAATALNRADVMQRRGLYPPPKGKLWRLRVIL